MEDCRIVIFWVDIDKDEYYAGFFNESYNPKYKWEFGDGTPIEYTDLAENYHKYHSCEK